jgi:hypothetical protein
MGRVLLGAGFTAIFLVTQDILILRTESIRGIYAYFGTAPRQELPRATPLFRNTPQAPEPRRGLP